MLIRTTKPGDVRAAEITPRDIALDRRRFLARAGTAALAATAAGLGAGLLATGSGPARAAVPIGTPARSPLSTGETPTPRDAVTSYNNFYEYGLDKADPAERAPKLLKSDPWSVTVDGAVARPGRIPLEELVAPHRIEERLYRLRCVEGWSMVIPWLGVPLRDVLARFEPIGAARFVAFETLLDPKQMPGQERRVLDWPYREGLRLDEAMHPLTLLAVGLYGDLLPAQNGAPVRLVVPWKYGFKSIKSIVRMTLVETRPPTSWNLSAPDEYGFYANVNPAVSHPRWSQAKERRIGDFFRRETLMFNGYADEVASLYAGMDLAREY